MSAALRVRHSHPQASLGPLLTGSREYAVQEPFAVVDAVAVIAIDPHRFAARVFGDEVIAAHVGAVPPARLDPLRARRAAPTVALRADGPGVLGSGSASSQTGRGATPAGSEATGLRRLLSRAARAIGRCVRCSSSILAFAPRALGPMLGVRRDERHRVLAQPRAQAIESGTVAAASSPGSSPRLRPARGAVASLASVIASTGAGSTTRASRSRSTADEMRGLARRRREREADGRWRTRRS